MTYDLTTTQIAIIAVLAVWELVWKGLALWKAGRQSQTAWFISILVINTAGLLPIIYLLIERNKEAGKPAK